MKLQALYPNKISFDHDRDRSGYSNRRESLPLRILATVVTIAVLLPVIYLFLRSLGLEENYLELIFRPATLRILANTAGLVLAVTLASIAISLPLAWLTVRTDLPMRRFWAITTTLPLVIPSYIGAYLFVASLGPRGIVAGWLKILFNIAELPSIYGFFGSVYILTLLSYPYILLSVRASLQGMDTSLEEAARGLGHSTLSTFWHVTLPRVIPALTAGSLLVALYVLRDFGAVSIMRFDTFTRVIYLQYKSSFDRVSAAAFSLILVALTLIILAAFRWRRSREHYVSSPHSVRHDMQIIRLKNWRWPALLFCGGVVLLALIVPCGVLVYWLVRGLLAGETLVSILPETVQSVFVASLAAVMTLLAAIPVSILSVRYPGRYSTFLERTSYLGYALPGLVIALALVFFGANLATPLYQTLPMLILAYIILFLPQAIGSLQSSLLQVSPSLEEAARSLGRTPFKVLTEISIPLVKPGVMAGLSLVFLTAMKELPATLILSPFGFKTLAMSVWTHVSEAFFTRAALPALVLVLISSVPMAFLIARERK
jgi:iron(III) transport system permease protein